jgi:hypothetical protein
MPVSNRALQVLSEALRQRRCAVGSRWRRLSAGEQALLVLAYLNKGETYTALAAGFGVGTATVNRTTPPTSSPGRYRPPDQLLAFLEAL